jgi:hypothetical protein
MKVASKAHSVRDLLNGFDVVAGNEFVVCVKELNPRFFERTLGQQQTLDTRKTLQAQSDITNKQKTKKKATFVWIIIRLFDEGQFFTLRLIQAA